MYADVGDVVDGVLRRSCLVGVADRLASLVLFGRGVDDITIFGVRGLVVRWEGNVYGEEDWEGSEMACWEG